jgi:SagB-type dehydrogenase family enzyme
MSSSLSANELFASGTLPVDSVSELYHEGSKQRRSDRAFVERILAAGASPLLQRAMFASRKRYRPAPRRELPAGAHAGELDNLVTNRRSWRSFESRPIELAHLSTLLRLAMGETVPADPRVGRPRAFRAAPSAGALYPLEAYVVAERVTDLAPGVHHYEAIDHALEHIDSTSRVGALAEATGMPELGATPAIVVLTAILARSRLKYGERAYRFVLLEAGHVAQNLLLAAEHFGLCACAIGGFVDDELDAILGIDGTDEVSLYALAIGHPETPLVGLASPISAG